MLARTLLVGIAAVGADPSTVSTEWDNREKEVQSASDMKLVEIDEDEQVDPLQTGEQTGVEKVDTVIYNTMNVAEVPAAGIKVCCNGLSTSRSNE